MTKQFTVRVKLTKINEERTAVSFYSGKRLVNRYVINEPYERAMTRCVDPVDRIMYGCAEIAVK